MKRLKVCFCTTIAIAALISILSAPAFADSYQILGLSNDANVSIDGIYSSGAVVLSNPFAVVGNCKPYPSSSCYITYVNGLAFSGSNTRPSIPSGGGGPIGGSCPSVPSDIPSSDLLFSFCTNGNVVYINDRYDNADGSIEPGGIFTSDGTTIQHIFGDIPYSSFGSPISVNSYGDIVWDDIGYEEIYEAYDVTNHLALGEVPEPASWSLIAIGMLAATMAIRRRHFC